MRELLNAAYSKDKLIQTRIKTLEQLRELAVSIGGGRTDDINVKRSKKQEAAFTSHINAILDMETELNDMIDDFVDAIAQIKRLIGTLEDSKARLILELRYLQLKSWDDIAEMIGYSERQCRRIHKKALEMLSDCEKPP